MTTAAPRPSAPARPRPSAPARPDDSHPTTARPAAPAPVLLGIDLGGTKIAGIAIDRLSGRTLAHMRVPTPRDDYAGTLAAIGDLATRLEQAARIAPTGIAQTGIAPTGIAPTGMLPIGIGIPGAISPKTGLVKNANSLWLNDRPLDRDLAAASGRAVRLANDANCLAVSEASDGAAAGAGVVFAVILGTGVGGGIAIQGRVHHGADAIAGEWGHVPMPWAQPWSRTAGAALPPDADRVPELPGPACYCGRSGCIETLLSGPGLAGDAARLRGQDEASALACRSAEAVIADARQGDEMAIAAIMRWRHRLGRAFAMVINLLDPDAIVIGGGLSQVPELMDAITCDPTPLIGPWLFSDRVRTPVVVARHGDDSGVRGAARLWDVAR
ncbi:ROK family protein [Tistrella bauzanensis]|uniref:ROK family protein n=1 Tax=Tistrella bauzanensis TaxID=657419 RepID=UPI001665E135|nr:ROK family protein [Tistrella bauzanensis]